MRRNGFAIVPEREGEPWHTVELAQLGLDHAYVVSTDVLRDGRVLFGVRRSDDGSSGALELGVTKHRYWSTAKLAPDDRIAGVAPAGGDAVRVITRGRRVLLLDNPAAIEPPRSQVAR